MEKQKNIFAAVSHSSLQKFPHLWWLRWQVVILEGHLSNNYLWPWMHGGLLIITEYSRSHKTPVLMGFLIVCCHFHRIPPSHHSLLWHTTTNLSRSACFWNTLWTMFIQTRPLVILYAIYILCMTLTCQIEFRRCSIRISWGFFPFVFSQRRHTALHDM